MTRPMCNTFCMTICIVLCAFVLLGITETPVQRLSRAEAAGAEDEYWSFRFTNLSVAEVLKQLSRETGIDIVTNRPPHEKRVTKSFEDHTVEEIIRDLFRGANYTLVWNYNETGLESIGINFFDQGTAGAVNRDSGSRPQPVNRGVARPARPTPRRAFSRTPPASEMDAGAPGEDYDTSDEQEDEADEEQDEADEEQDEEEKPAVTKEGSSPEGENPQNE